MSKEDHLSNEIAISARLEERGVAASAKSRALVAFDRLLGSAADIPTAYLENIAKKARLRGELERKKLIEVSQGPEQRDPFEDGAYLQAKSAEDEAERIENLSKVVDASVDQLSEEATIAEDNKEIDPDWLNRFRAYAAEISTETMQSLWGRVLAGEIQNPNTFSLSTLRILSELDQNTARTFQEKAKLVLNGEYIPKPKLLSGQSLAEFGLLEEAGLLRDIGGFTGIDKEPGPDGKIYLREGKLLLIAEASTKKRLSVIPLTRIGKELLSMLPKPDPLSGLQAAFSSLDSEQIAAAKIAVILEELPEGQIRYSDVEVLKHQS